MPKYCQVSVIGIKPDYSEEVLTSFDFDKCGGESSAMNRAEIWIDENSHYDIDGIVFYTQKREKK